MLTLCRRCHCPSWRSQGCCDHPTRDSNSSICWHFIVLVSDTSCIFLTMTWLNLCASAFWLLWWGCFGASAFWFLFGLFCFLPAWGVCSLVYPDTFLFLLFGSRDRRRILSFFFYFFSFQIRILTYCHHWFYLLFCFPCLLAIPYHPDLLGGTRSGNKKAFARLNSRWLFFPGGIHCLSSNYSVSWLVSGGRLLAFGGVMRVRIGWAESY